MTEQIISTTRGSPAGLLERRSGMQKSQPQPDRQESSPPCDGVSLSRLWLDAMADEARHGAPFERMATAALSFASGVTVLLAVTAGQRFLEGWVAFVEFARDRLW